MPFDLSVISNEKHSNLLEKCLGAVYKSSAELFSIPELQKKKLHKGV